VENDGLKKTSSLHTNVKYNEPKMFIFTTRERKTKVDGKETSEDPENFGILLSAHRKIQPL
jgi:hypothetical protein